MSKKHQQKENLLDNSQSVVDVLFKLFGAPSELTLEEWLKEWFSTYKEGRLKSSTLRDYRMYMDRYIIPALGSVKLVDLDGVALQKFINGIERPNMKKKIAFLLRSALEKAKKTRRLYFNPFDSVELPKNKGKHYKPLEFDIQDKILHNASERYAYAFRFLCCTGMRVGEFLALDFNKDVNRRRRLIFISKTVDIDTGELQSSPKTESSFRAVPYIAELDEVVDYLCEHKYTYYSLRLYFSRLYRRMRLKGYNLHTFRHTFVSVCCSVGMRAKTVQSIVGHSDINLTLNLYTHVLRKGRSFLYDYVKKLQKMLE